MVAFCLQPLPASNGYHPRVDILRLYGRTSSGWKDFRVVSCQLIPPELTASHRYIYRGSGQQRCCYYAMLFAMWTDVEAAGLSHWASCVAVRLSSNSPERGDVGLRLSCS